MPWSCYCFWFWRRCFCMVNAGTAASDLHHRFSGSYQMGYGSYDLYLSSLFLKRTAGCYNRRCPWIGNLCYSNPHLYTEYLRRSYPMDIHHFPNSAVPYHAMPVSFLHHLMDRNDPIPVSNLCLCLQKEIPRNAIAHILNNRR